MKGLITLPSRIRHPELNGLCSEKMCQEKPVYNALILDMGGLPIDFYVILCEEHAKDLTRLNEVELAIASDQKKRWSTKEDKDADTGSK